MPPKPLVLEVEKIAGFVEHIEKGFLQTRKNLTKLEIVPNQLLWQEGPYTVFFLPFFLNTYMLFEDCSLPCLFTGMYTCFSYFKDELDNPSHLQNPLPNNLGFLVPSGVHQEGVVVPKTPGEKLQSLLFCLVMFSQNSVCP